MASQVLKVICFLVANETSQLGGSHSGKFKAESSFSEARQISQEMNCYGTTYLHTRLPALGSQEGEEGHGWDQHPSQAGRRHHFGIFCVQKGLCETWHAVSACWGGRWGTAAFSLAPAGCPRTVTVFRTALLRSGQEEVRVATLAFWAFVSLIFMSPVTGEEVRRRRTKRLQISGPSNSKRKLASIPGSHLTSGLVNLGKQTGQTAWTTVRDGGFLISF